MPCELAPCCTERHPHRKLVPPCRRAREGERRDVDAGNEQHAGRETEKSEERRARITDGGAASTLHPAFDAGYSAWSCVAIADSSCDAAPTDVPARNRATTP